MAKRSVMSVVMGVITRLLQACLHRELNKRKSSIESYAMSLSQMSIDDQTRIIDQ